MFIAYKISIWILCIFTAMILVNGISSNFQTETGETLWEHNAYTPNTNPYNTAFKVVNASETQGDITEAGPGPIEKVGEYFLPWRYLLKLGSYVGKLWNVTFGLPSYLVTSWGWPSLWANPIGLIIDISFVALLYCILTGKMLED